MTAKEKGLNPEKNLMHIFTVLPDRFAKDSNTSVEDLLLSDKNIEDLCKLRE